MDRKRTVICLFLFVFSLLAGGANGAEKRVLGRDYFKELFFEKVTAGTPWPKENLAIDNFTAYPDSLPVMGKRLSYTVEGQTYSDCLGRKTLTLQVRVDGRQAGSVKMSGDLLLFREVVCLKQSLSRHSVLDKADVELVRRNVSFLGNDLVLRLEEAVGQRLRSSLRAGTVLTAAELEPAPLVFRGDKVTILAQSDRFSITVPGEVRSPGAKGETVKVKNLMSRKEIYARVVSPEIVSVDLL